MRTAGDSKMALYEVVQQYERNVWLIPEHQRSDRWNVNKQRAWWDRIRAARERPGYDVPGTILTYELLELNGNSGPIYINDGQNRVRALVKVLSHPASCGERSRDEVEQILRDVTITVQHRHYKTEQEAQADFIRLNEGETLTPYEKARGIIAYHSRYRDEWKPLLERVHQHISGMYRTVDSRIGNGIKADHKLRRYELVLLIRFFRANAPLYIPKAGSANLTARDLEHRDLPERQIQQLFGDFQPGDLAHGIAKFLNRIDSEVQTIATVWRDVRTEPAMGIKPGALDWLLEVALWRYHQSIPIKRWEAFLRAFLSETQGSFAITRNGNQVFNARKGDLASLARACSAVGADLADGMPERKRLSIARPAGTDISHVQPFAEHGNGPVVIESSSSNRARGAQPIDNIGG